MAVKGVFGSDSAIQGDPKGDFASALLQEVPTGSSPLFALSSGMPSRAAMDTVVNWFEEVHISGRTTLNGALASTSATSLPVADASSYPAGMVGMIETTGEYVYVTAVVGNTLTIVRGFGGTVAATASNGDGFQRIATAAEEGSAAPVAIANLGAPLYNYAQLLRNTWNVTGTAKAVDYYTGSKVEKNRRDAMLAHGEDIERAMIFGRRSMGVKNNQPFRTMNGIDAMVSTNITAAGGTTNWTQLDTFLRGIFGRNIKGKPNERIAFTGNVGLQVINNIARLNSTVYLEPGATEFGLKINKWLTPYGNITLMTHPLFVESPLWTKDLRVYHPGAIELRWLRRTFNDDYATNGTRAGIDADFGVFTSELSVEYHVEKTAGRLTGLTAAAVG